MDGAADEHEPAELGQAVVLPEPRGEPPDARPEAPRVRHVAEELGAPGWWRSRDGQVTAFLSRVGGVERGQGSSYGANRLSRENMPDRL